MFASRKITKRRERKHDPMANPESIRRVLNKFRNEFPNELPSDWSEMKTLLAALRHKAVYVSKNSNRGRPGKFQPATLNKFGDCLNEILNKESKGRLSVRTFVDHYLKILEFPADVVEILVSGEINLFEAEQLARIKPSTLGVSNAEAVKRRKELAQTHRQLQESGSRLRIKVNQILEQVSNPYSDLDQDETSFVSVDPVLVSESDLGTLDPAHIFYDQMNQILFAMQNLKAEELDQNLLDEILESSDLLLNLLAQARKKTKSKGSLQI